MHVVKEGKRERERDLSKEGKSGGQKKWMNEVGEGEEDEHGEETGMNEGKVR